VEEAGGITFIMDVFVSYPDSEVKESLISVWCRCEVRNDFRWAGVVQWLTKGWTAKVWSQWQVHFLFYVLWSLGFLSNEY
jgi:hypothetical protein